MPSTTSSSRSRPARRRPWTRSSASCCRRPGGRSRTRPSTPDAAAGSNTGVYVGVMASEWSSVHLTDFARITAQQGAGAGYFMSANRLSYHLDLKGPSVAVDTACSSSLVAVHQACAALRAGACDQALAGGVNLVLTPALNIFYTQAGLSAPDGRCKPFSAHADGIGRGEGVAVLVLRRLADAVDAGLPIYAVIEGGAVNSDGRSNGITAPNRWAQKQVRHERLPGRRRAARADRLRRGPRHRHRARRHDRGQGARRRARPPLAPRGAVRDRVDQGQHRPHRGRGRHRRSHQGGAQPAPRHPAAQPVRGRAQPAAAARRQRPAAGRRADGVARRRRARRGEQLRHRRDQRPHGAGQRSRDAGRRRRDAVARHPHGVIGEP